MTELDYMEYANDAAAQAAYVSSDIYSADRIPTMTSNTAPSGVASANSEIIAAWKAMNDASVGDSDMWYATGGFPHWLQYQFTSGKVIQRYTIKTRNHADTVHPFDWTLEASNTGAWGGEEVVLDTQTGQSFNQAEKKTYSFTNFTSYTYYRLVITDGDHATVVGIDEFELIEIILQCYSEDTIVEEGTYSLKGFALDTDALNETLTRTVNPTIDLSGLDDMRLVLYSLRTGANIKVGIHDVGGATSEITPTIVSGNTWEVFRLDLSGVADADKDAIDSIIITIVNADADNTFYIDYVFAGPFAQALADALAFTDTLTKKTKKPLTDSLAFTDTIAKKMMLQRTIFADALTFTDTLVKKSKKPLADTLAFTDTLIKKVKKVLADNLAFTDTIVKKTSRALADTLALTDTLVKETKRLLTDNLAFTDTITKKTNKALADTLAFTDTLIKKTKMTLVDNLAFTDALVKKIKRVLLDNISFTDRLILKGLKRKFLGGVNWTKSTAPSDVSTKLDKPGGTWTKLDRPGG